MNEKLEILNEELENFIDVLLFFNKNFNKFQRMNIENNKLYYHYLTLRYKNFLFQKEKILKQ